MSQVTAVTLPAPSPEPLTARYDAALFDLDGVLYLQEEPVPYAPEGVAAARSAGMRIGFVTNNASRRGEAVAALLAAVGVPAHPDEVVTAAQAAAALLAERFPPGSAVLVVGADALAGEIAAVGLVPVRTAGAGPVAVVQGYAPDVDWAQLAEACVAIRAGVWWVATNQDLTIPSARGPLPGNGALVAALAAAVRREPDETVGKPHPRLHQESVRRTGARRPLVVGDRLDTDVAGAIAGGADSLLVLTGVTDPAELLQAGPGERPTYLAADLRGLTEVHPGVHIRSDGLVVCHGWTAARRQTQLVLGGGPLGTQDSPEDGMTRVDGVVAPYGAAALDALRALAGAAWSPEPARPGVDPGVVTEVVATGPAAGQALAALGLDG